MKATNNLYNGVHGSSTIDHRIRCKLGLSVAEYCIAEFYSNFFKNQKDTLITEKEVWKALGMDYNDYIFIDDNLRESKPGILGIKEAGPLWKKEFNFDEDFEVFWQNIFQRHGNKADAQKKYKECRKIVDKQILHTRAAQYIMQCCPSFPNYTKAAEVWLNPKKRHWEDVLPGDRKLVAQVAQSIFPKD
jgi:hypothetical protein